MNSYYNLIGSEKMDEILVSINCITYNHENYIAEAIDSFLMQKTNFKFEILIHDDASSDRTADIIREYEKKYPDIIKPILQKENQKSKGVININYRFNHTRAKGKYIAMCEGDDYWIDSYKLQKQIDYLENHTHCSMCFHAAEIVTICKEKIDIIKPYNENCISITDDIILGGGGFMATNSIVYRRDAMSNPPQLYFDWPVGDYPLQILTSMKNYAYYINEIMSAYRVGVKGSWTTKMTSSKDSKDKNVKHIEKTIVLLNEFNEYSNEKYSDAINKRISKLKIEILIIKKKLKELKDSNYKIIYDSLGIKEKIKIYIKSYFPNTYKKLVRLIIYIKKSLNIYYK